LVNLRVARRKVFVFEVGIHALSSFFSAFRAVGCLGGIYTLRLLVFIWTGIDSRVWGLSYMPQHISSLYSIPPYSPSHYPTHLTQGHYSSP